MHARNPSLGSPVHSTAKPVGGQSGFGLIEILVTVLILAIGLLGMASLQSVSLQQSTEARNRSQAVFLARDILERARANRNKLSEYSTTTGKAPDCKTNFAIASGSSVSVNDTKEWKNSLACLIPDGNGSVKLDGNMMTVTVTWTPHSGQRDGDPSAAEIDGAGEITVEAEI